MTYRHTKDQVLNQIQHGTNNKIRGLESGLAKLKDPTVVVVEVPASGAKATASVPGGTRGAAPILVSEPVKLGISVEGTTLSVWGDVAATVSLVLF